MKNRSTHRRQSSLRLGDISQNPTGPQIPPSQQLAPQIPEEGPVEPHPVVCLTGFVEKGYVEFKNLGRIGWDNRNLNALSYAQVIGRKGDRRPERHHRQALT